MFTLQNDIYTRFITRFITIYLIAAISGLSMYKTSYRPLSRMEIVESIIADQGAVLDHMTPRQASAEIRKKAKQHEESQRSEWNTLQSFNCELPLIPQSLVLTSKVLFVQSSIPAVVMHGYRNIPGRPPAC